MKKRSVGGFLVEFGLHCLNGSTENHVEPLATCPDKLAWDAVAYCAKKSLEYNKLSVNCKKTGRKYEKVKERK